MRPDPRQIEATRARFQERQRERARNERLIDEGRFLEVDRPDRVEKFLARHGFAAPESRAILRGPMEARAAIRPASEGREGISLERILGTNDLIGVAFLELGLQVARSIGRIWIAVSSGRPAGFGTGFMISPRLLMTNHHVLESSAVARTSLVELDYQLGIDGGFLPTTSFSLEPDTFFFANPHLDYAVVAVRPIGTAGRTLDAFGWNPLIEEEGKAIISQWLNVIQHPNGEVKQLGLRENQLIDVLEEFLHYRTDTAPGSSGAPVYNDRWEVVGLHHSGVWETNAAGQILAVDGRVWDESMGEHRIKWIANEGVRVSRIVADLRRQRMNAEQRRLFDQIFTVPPRSSREREEERPVPAPIAAPPPQEPQMSLSPDGTATWTIPLRVSVQLGGSANAQTAGGPFLPVSGQPTTPPPPQGDSAASTAASVSPQSILEAARRELGERADVLDVRLGYLFRNGWITKERAVVVTVRRKAAPAALREARISELPATFQGLPVEVVNPTIEDVVEGARGPVVAEAAFSERAVLPQEITYVPPDNSRLDPVTDVMRVVAHVSPDAGWPVLSRFLSETRKQMVVGIYDFGAPHIVEALEDVAQRESFRKLTLVMQSGESVGEGTKADDLRDNEVVERLGQALGDRLENAWVKTGSVTGWVSSSYHIKVAVRDQKAFWLSSGNWQSSNQPPAAPLTENPRRRQWLDRYNREWHAVVEHAGLARQLEKYLLHDFRNNLDNEAEEALNLPDLLVPEALLVARATESTSQFQYFDPFDESRQFTVTPLLTPDNYHQRVLELVRSAREELLIQNQTFKAPRQNHRKLRELIDAVIERQQEGVRVRVIFRILMTSDARRVLEDLQDYGLDVSSVKVQKNCHTKGIIVDRQTVLVGSQNWSNDGVSVNRDASLLFEDEPLAAYFARIFEHDWNNLARQNIGPESLAVEWVPGDQPTPPGMVRLGWKDYMEML